MKLTIDRDRCTGHGRCYTLVPELFECDDDGYGVVLVADVSADQIERARTGVVNCPEDAITLEEAP